MTLAELLSAMRRGAHARDLQHLVRTDAMRNVQRKVMAMRESIERQKALSLHVISGGKP